MQRTLTNEEWDECQEEFAAAKDGMCQSASTGREGWYRIEQQLF